MKTKNPLLDRAPKAIVNWTEWLKLWEEATHTEVLHGLLHVGFDVQTEDDQDFARVYLYLSLADGYATGCGDLVVPGEGTVERDIPHRDSFLYERPPWMRRAWLARKAFDMLAQRFFRCEGKYGGHFFRERRLDNPLVFESVLDFFYEWDPKLRSSRLKNLHRNSADHNEKRVQEFLFALITWAWGTTRRDSTHVSYEELRPKMVHLLDGMDRLDVFLPHSYITPDHYCRADKATLETLERLVTEQSHTHLSSKPIKSVKDAAKAGLKAAQTLLVLRSIT